MSYAALFAAVFWCAYLLSGHPGFPRSPEAVGPGSFSISARGGQPTSSRERQRPCGWAMGKSVRTRTCFSLRDRVPMPIPGGPNERWSMDFHVRSAQIDGESVYMNDKVCRLNRSMQHMH